MSLVSLVLLLALFGNSLLVVSLAEEQTVSATTARSVIDDPKMSSNLNVQAINFIKPKINGQFVFCELPSVIPNQNETHCQAIMDKLYSQNCDKISAIEEAKQESWRQAEKMVEELQKILMEPLATNTRMNLIKKNYLEKFGLTDIDRQKLVMSKETLTQLCCKDKRNLCQLDFVKEQIMKCNSYSGVL